MKELVILFVICFFCALGMFVYGLISGQVTP